ncbi:MAG: pyridoxal-phosphate dependent enzyme, partial [Caulobacter sp.]|nr:pyridoxal-phosphate dependent enzyme [Vitreoscilla sp.]
MAAARPPRESSSDADTGRSSGIAGITPAAPLSRAAQAIAGDYLRRILTARVYDVAVETPLEPARNLSRRLGNQVLLKREDTQSVFSFKLRGAYNKMINLAPAALQRGVICASA